MFFDPIWLYLKGLTVTLVVEVLMFALIISKKPIRITAAACFNVLSHILLHLFFTLMLRSALGYNIYIWIAGEIMVVVLEAFLYWGSKLIPKLSKAFLWSFMFNISSIIVGQIINLFLF